MEFIETLQIIRTPGKATKKFFSCAALQTVLNQLFF